MDKITAIKQEIERRLKENTHKQSLPQFFGMMEEDLRLLDFINSLPEEPVSINFEQELYKQFGQVKDFTIGLKIAEHFYHLGAVKEAEYNRDSEYKLSQMAVDVLDRKRVKPTLKGDALHRFKNEWNTIRQIMHWWREGYESLNYRLALHWASWGAQNLQGHFGISEDKKAKMDIKEEPVSEELEVAAENALNFDEKIIVYDDPETREDSIEVYTREQSIEMFKLGSKWQKQQTINKACDYLFSILSFNVPYYDEEDKFHPNGAREVVIEKLRKALEEG